MSDHEFFEREAPTRSDTASAGVSTAERIRSLAPQRQQHDSGAAMPGMRAAEAMALVQAMAASPGHPTTHGQDLEKISPLVSMFASGLSSSLVPPGALAELTHLLPQPRQHSRWQDQVSATAVASSPSQASPSDGPGFSAIFRSPLAPSAPASRAQRTPNILHDALSCATDGSGGVPAAGGSQPDVGRPAAPTQQSDRRSSTPDAGVASAAAAPASGGKDAQHEALLDVLTATMDAWETALTKRLTAAVSVAVAEARRDVMEVRSGSKWQMWPDDAARTYRPATMWAAVHAHTCGVPALLSLCARCRHQGDIIRT